MLEVRAILDNFYTSDVGNLDQPYVTELTGEWQGPIAPEGTEPCG
jgi:hypothetical protein